MECRKKIVEFLLIIFFVFIIPTKSICQINIKINSFQVSVNDTLNMSVWNNSKKVGQYFISWEVFERKQWRMMKVDIWNNIPMSEKWNKIQSLKNENKYYVIDNIFTGTFKKYKELPGRLVLTYSYSKDLEPRRIIYSTNFIVKSKQ